MQKRIVKETLTNGGVQYRVEKFAKPAFFLKRRWITDTICWNDPLGDPFMDIEIDAIFDTLEEAEEHIFSEMPNPIIKREVMETNIMEKKEAINILQALLDSEMSLNTKQAIAIGIEEIKNSEDRKLSNKILFAAFDAGYKACMNETLNWLHEKGDDYIWFLEDDGGLTEELFDDLEKYLNSKREVNDL